MNADCLVRNYSWPDKVVEETPQTENTRFHPRSPYGITKVTGFDLTRHFREAYDVFACSGILFNHESPRRGFEFVTRKVTSNLARIRKTGYFFGYTYC